MNNNSSGSNSSSSDNNDGGFPGSANSIAGFRYGIGISIGVLILITTMTLVAYFCTRTQQRHQQSTHDDHNYNNQLQNHDNDSVIEVHGIDEATLKSYPKLLYSQAKLQNSTESNTTTNAMTSTTTATTCSICLADYKNSDMLRLLPDCGHIFHLKCVDPWLRQHPTCPICRTSPLPSPLSTPLAEVVPLARTRD